MSEGSGAAKNIENLKKHVQNTRFYGQKIRGQTGLKPEWKIISFLMLSFINNV